MNKPEIIYHVTTKAEWLKAIDNNGYTAPSLFTEGFIHCSKEEQVKGVLERYFKNIDGKVKLVIDASKLSNKLVYELAPSINQYFPHVFGAIDIDAVIDVIAID